MAKSPFLRRYYRLSENPKRKPGAFARIGQSAGFPTGKRVWGPSSVEMRQMAPPSCRRSNPAQTVLIEQADQHVLCLRPVHPVYLSRRLGIAPCNGFVQSAVILVARRTWSLKLETIIWMRLLPPRRTSSSWKAASARAQPSRSLASTLASISNVAAFSRASCSSL